MWISSKIFVLIISVIKFTCSLELKCDYATLKSVSKCVALEWNIVSENENVTEFKGRQKNLKNDDVNTLRISYQNVKFLPDGIFTLFPKLNTLEIYHSSLQNLEAHNFINATELKKIDICRNNMTVLEQNTFVETKNLMFLEMMQNKLTIISQNAFSGLTKLWELSLKKNLVINLPESVFKELTSLRMLDLSHNQIKEVNSQLFATNRDLEDLNLDFNHIENLDGELFKFNLKLSLIFISHNHIKTIGSQLLTFSDTFRKLNFYGNHCINDCTGIPSCRTKNVNVFIEELRKMCSSDVPEVSDVYDIVEPTYDEEYGEDQMFDTWDTDLSNEENEIFPFEPFQVDSKKSIVKVNSWNSSWLICVLSVLSICLLFSFFYRKYIENKIKSREENITMNEVLISEDS